MQTLFIISSTAFVLAALAWFSTWAFWLHPPEGWLGKEVVAVTPIAENDRVRHAAWFRCIKLVTLLLGVLTAALFASLVNAHPW